MLIALTREVSPALAACELTHLQRVAIDVDRARAQHGAYEAALVQAGCKVERISSDDQMPDSVFIEDLAVVVAEAAVITRPGAQSRRREAPGVVEALGRHRRLGFLEAPATLDGGDVLVVGRDVFVGRSGRTNDAGIDQLRSALSVHGYSVFGVEVRGCLHLKSAVTAITDGLLLINPEWISAGVLRGRDCVSIDPTEPHAANALRIGARVIYPSSFPRTARQLEKRGVHLHTVDASELQKAEGAVTCCSLVFDA